MATPRTTPRSTPIPRWTTPFIPLDELDYNNMIAQITSNNSDDNILQDGEQITPQSFSDTSLLAIHYQHWTRASMTL